MINSTLFSRHMWWDNELEINVSCKASVDIVEYTIEIDRRKGIADGVTGA